MKTLILTDEQASVLRTALIELHDSAYDGVRVNTNYYGNHRSLDYKCSGEDLQSIIDSILNMDVL